jgi:signal transduction histidine kinase
MKQVNWVCWTFKRFIAVCLLLCAFGAHALHMIEIGSAQEALSNTPPTVDTPWKPLALPAHWVTPEEDPLRKQWIKFNFYKSLVPEAGLVLYVPRLYNGGTFYLNGLRINGVKPPNENEFVRWRRPFFIELPNALLLPGNNEVMVETAYRSGANGISRFYVGTAEQLERRYNTSFFFKHTVARLVAVFSVVAGLFLLMFWWRRRQEVLYGLLGAASLAWALRTMNFIVEVIPIDLRQLLRFTYYLGTGVFVLCLMLMVLRILKRNQRLGVRALIAYCLVGPLISLMHTSWAETVVDLWWQAGLLLIAACGAAGLGYAAWKERSVENIGLLIAGTLAFLMAAIDYFISTGVLDFDTPYGAHLAAPLLLFVMGGILLDRFVRTLNKVEGMTHSLIDEVAARETELRTKYEEIQAFERRRVTLEERTRIMQDMHDGLGSQLLSSLVMVERTEVSKQEMVGILRDALDDLRLAIDAFAPDGADLLPALGNLRFRMQSRFKAANIKLSWNVVNVPDTLTLPGTSTLPILRIVQESLTNIFKHANATEAGVHISTQANPLSLIISISDNGAGFDLATLPQRGRGLTNLRKRANRAGSTLRIASKPGQGTQVFLAVPLAQ